MLSIPHRRFNPLIKSWILVSPHRIDRPWDGQTEKPVLKDDTIDKNNPLRPNAIRSKGDKNPDYKSIYVFKNDFPALLDSLPEKFNLDYIDDELFRVKKTCGDCYVMCYDPRPNVTLATMSVDEVVSVIKTWKEIVSDIGVKYDWVQIFENRGEMMGCSNMHPHCQIWATDYVPTVPAMKQSSQKEYFDRHQTPMLYDYALKEKSITTRVVAVNDSWICLVPFWAEWPFETMVIPLRLGVARLTDLTAAEDRDLALLLQILLRKYNGLFGCPFPYSMGWLGAPTGTYLGQDVSHWTLHASYYPPLLRSASVKKFFVGFELLAESQRDLTPEKAAEMLRNVL